MDEPRPDRAARAVDDELRAARPASDHVDMAAVRARAERALFGHSTPPRLGRYLVVERIAGGGMGVVYRGYDPDLHRKVALKVLHPRIHGDERAHARLLAEARALARLDHHNVVRIHDVIADGGEVVVVMEHAEGDTLAAWERARPRAWREVVDAYVQAGRGMAAAHAIGIVHRDFKPANVMVGGDGRVRVLDFGLARAGDGTEMVPLATGSPGTSGTSAEVDGLTATGEVVGTLSYTSPEQLAGEVATAASDQYSFCVALHRAIEGRPPFSGTDQESLLAAHRVGAPACATDGRRVPAWLRAAIARGLSTKPEQRHASVQSLLHELTRPRGWRRWRAPALVAVVVAVLAVLAIRSRPAGGAEPCDGGRAEIAAVWNGARRQALASHLHALALFDGDDLVDRVTSGLDHYRAQWSELHRHACRAHRRGEQSAELLDRRMACMGQRRGDLGSAVEVLERTDAHTIGRAIDVVVGLPPLDDCQDISTLLAANQPPVALADRPRVAAIRTMMSLAGALDRAGRNDEALAVVASAVDAARAVGDEPVLAEADLERGRILMATGAVREAQTSLREARRLGLRHGRSALAVEAAARTLYLDQTVQSDLERLQRDAAVLEPMSEAVARDRIARPLLLNNIGVAFMAAGDRGRAHDYFTAALAARVTPAQVENLELAIIEANLALVTEDASARLALLRTVWTRRKTTLGPHHLLTLQALDMLARMVREPRDAATLMSEVSEGYRRSMSAPGMAGYVVYAVAYQAFLTELVGDAPAAATLFAEAARVGMSSLDPDNFTWAALAWAERERLMAHEVEAVDAYERVIAAVEGSADAWRAQLATHACLGLARLCRPAQSTCVELPSQYDGYAKTSFQSEFVFRRGLAEDLARSPRPACNTMEDK